MKILALTLAALPFAIHAADKPIKIFIVAGDELVLEQAPIQSDKPGSLADVIAKNPEYAWLRSPSGVWTTRDDVVLFDAHPIHNNTETAGHLLTVGDIAYGGRRPRGMIGIEQSLGHALGNHFDAPVMLLRFGTHPADFKRGSRSLSHDYLPPSSGGTPAADAKWDIIHFNWGIWDIAYRDPKPNDKWHSCVINGKLTTPLDVYEKNLRELVGKMKATGATLVWGSITPVHPDTPGRKAEDPARYNAVAAKIMQENGVRITDLYSASIKQGFPKKPDVHSIGNLAPKAIEGLEAALASRRQKNSSPPRILLIGDSITGSYQNAVMKHFEGRAEVYKNPGNAEHTGTGLKYIDKWLYPKTYPFSGQEYMELVNGVKKTLADMDRYYPEYKGQPVEVAGLVWFQGLADASSARMAAAYQDQLPKLIQNLRKDLGKPELPVVITGIADDGTHAATVLKAQLAAANPAKRISAIDSRPFVHAPGQSSCTRADIYHQNAASYLKLGEAIGKTLIEIQKQ